MLKSLHIENAAVIERADVEFQRGLNVLTGETGAGKSIVIDALGAVLGGKTSHSLVRTGASFAVIQAVFSDPAASAWCERELVPCEDEDVYLTRKITADGKNSCRINGVPVPASQLRELGSLLLDIHGQNDGQRLLDEKNHRRYLDSYGELEASVLAYRNSYEDWRKTCQEAEALDMDEGEKERKLDSLRYQIEEIERAELVPGESEELKERLNLVKNAARITDALEEACEAFFGGNTDNGVLSDLDTAHSSLAGASRWSQELGPIADKLQELRYSAEDIAEEIRDSRDAFEFQPGELDRLQGRLDQIRRLTRKYGGSEEELLSWLEKAKEELDSITFSDEKLKRLRAEAEKKYQHLLAEGEKLRAERKKTGEKLSSAIERELQSLSMRGTRFCVELVALSKPSPDGLEEVRFLMSANAGEAPGRISKIASGGELSRIMLAMKTVLSAHDAVETMVFDEIDTGVSGIAAQRVGEKLGLLADTKQLICVTHLPQIGVMADTQLCVRKEVKLGRTYTAVEVLDEEGRIREIARLTGGERITELTCSAAKEQLIAAAEYKKCKRLERESNNETNS